MYYSDYPAMDELRYSAAQERRAADLPVCDYCGDKIYDADIVILKGDVICKRCIKRNTVTLTEDDYD